ncbi:MAG: M23 family metallopeptidase [Candidatus Peribacteraceae bacterium]|nr:M23 family metallopeptidase [Candidatus Peribacteraceae bacterium]
MIFSPIADTPLITQGFGQNPDMYAAYGLAGHNGIDFGVAEGTTVYAPHDGKATVVNSGASGYGLHVVIEHEKRRSLLAHLSAADVQSGQEVYQGDPIGRSGSSGASTGPHLHWTYKVLKSGVVQNRANGYDGAMDVTEFTRLWLDKDLHYDAQYAEEAKPYLSGTFAADQYLRNPSRVA